MQIKFSKMHGLGNDFIVINNLKLKHQFSPQQIQSLSARKLGIGCDQVLLIEQATDCTSDFYYRIYNSDGSEAEQCGNGARCVIRYIIDQGLTAKSQVQLQTKGSLIKGQLLANGSVSVNLGQPQFRPELIPFTKDAADIYNLSVADQVIEFNALSLGNPHAIISVDNLRELDDDERLSKIGQALQKSAYFPASVNVSFVCQQTPQQLVVRTYERGCGFTLACGSGACASAAALIKSKQLLAPIEVVMRGGKLVVIWNGHDDLIMEGPAAHVFNGEVELCEL